MKLLLILLLILAISGCGGWFLGNPGSWSGKGGVGFYHPEDYEWVNPPPGSGSFPYPVKKGTAK